MKTSQARRDAILALLPPDAPLVVDVGADHGYLAAAAGAVAVERRPHRRGRAPVPWVIADGLLPFRAVPVAVLAGLGARTIARVLQAGPRPEVAVLHATDDPGWLRTWLGAHGWRLDAESLAREGPRFAELLRVVPGVERATGLLLEHGPRLLEGGHPLRGPWLEARLTALARVREAVGHADPARAAELDAALTFLRGWRR